MEKLDIVKLYASMQKLFSQFDKNSTVAFVPYKKITKKGEIIFSKELEKELKEYAKKNKKS